MLEDEPRARETRRPYLVGAAACIALLVAAGFLPGYRAQIEVRSSYLADRERPETFWTGPAQSLFDEPRWPYLAALVLSCSALILTARFAAAARPSVASLVLLVGTVPSAALISEYADPESYHEPFAVTARATATAAKAADGREQPYAHAHIDALVGVWVTVGVILALAIGALLWVAQCVVVPKSRRFAILALVGVGAAGLLGAMWAQGSEEPCPGERSESDIPEISHQWGAWLALYLSFALLVLGVAGLARRRWWGGAALLLGGLALLVVTAGMALVMYLCIE